MDFDQSKNFGVPVTNWVKPPFPDETRWSEEMQGQYVRLEPLEAVFHCYDLFTAFKADDKNQIWDYLSYGPFDTMKGLETWITEECNGSDSYFFAVVDQITSRAIGIASYLHINPESGSIEVGHINFAPVLQSTTGATEAMYLMMRWAFLSGYRRYEWKCNALNLKSRRAAQRLGLSYEGVFRQATIVKGRNRDTAWFAAIDSEWPALQAAFENWLNPDNFDMESRQRHSLSKVTVDILVKHDPALTL